MTSQDLSEYAPEWIDPVSIDYRGWTVSELPPNTQGIATLIMLNIMQRLTLPDASIPIEPIATSSRHISMDLPIFLLERQRIWPPLTGMATSCHSCRVSLDTSAAA